MAKKISIYLGAPLERLLAERQSDVQQPTTVVNAVADRYLQVVRRSLPALTSNEWMLVFDALNGLITWDSADRLAAIYANISDVIRVDGLDRKWSVDGPALVQKLRALSYGETIALVDVAERFWARFGNQPVEIAGALQQLGVMPAE